MIKRYAIYWADLNPVIGSEISKVRPVIVVSEDTMNKYLQTVVVCPLTSKLHPQWRSRMIIDCAGKTSEIAVDQIRTLSKLRIRDQIDTLKDESSAELQTLIIEMYGTA